MFGAQSNRRFPHTAVVEVGADQDDAWASGEPDGDAGRHPIGADEDERGAAPVPAGEVGVGYGVHGDPGRRGKP